MLNEKEAWLFLSEEYKKPSYTSPITTLGLCWAVKILYSHGHVSKDTRETMYKRLMYNTPWDVSVAQYWWPVDEAHRSMRSDQARKLAELCAS